MEGQVTLQEPLSWHNPNWLLHWHSMLHQPRQKTRWLIDEVWSSSFSDFPIKDQGRGRVQSGNRFLGVPQTILQHSCLPCNIREPLFCFLSFFLVCMLLKGIFLVTQHGWPCKHTESKCKFPYNETKPVL